MQNSNTLKMTPYAGRHYFLLQDGGALLAVKVFSQSHVSGGSDRTFGWRLYRLTNKQVTVANNKLVGFSEPSVCGTMLFQATSLSEVKRFAQSFLEGS